LQKDTLKKFEEAGYQLEGYDTESRNYRPWINDEEIELKILRPQEIPIYVERGSYDIGITGHDWVLENDYPHGRLHKVKEILDLEYGKVWIVLAVPAKWNEVKLFEDLLNMGKREIRISTEYLNLSIKFILDKTGSEPSVFTPWHRMERKGHIKLFLSFGATEGKPPEDAEAIIDNTSSARTISENGLKVIETILHSSAQLIANSDSLKDPWKREKISEIAKALKGEEKKP
jgi:ATP phosphoribosyltransferase